MEGRAAEAETLARNVLARDPRNARAVEIMATIRLEQNRPDEAMELLKPGLAAAPGHAVLLVLMGAAHARKGQYRTAMANFQKAVQAAPDNVTAWEHLGKTAFRLRRWDHARAAFDHCLQIDPHHADARAGLARIEMTDGNLDRAIDEASTVVRRRPDHVMAREVVAESLLRQGKNDQALAEALAITELPRVRAKMKVLAWGLAARAAENLERFQDAFGYYTAMNNAVAEAYARGYDRAQVRESNDKLRGIVDLGPMLAERAKSWRSKVLITPTIYYMGFVNSGMSVFTNIMLRHPLLVDGRKKRAVRAWEQLVWPEDAVDRVAAVTFEDVEGMRRDFNATFEECNIEVGPGQYMFDQRPFYSRVMTTLALILPDAKYILGHRDPRDVVIECFKHRSSPNVSMYEFLELERAARYYDSAMETALRARDDYGLEIIELGYDDLIADPEGETRRVLKALGLPWDDALYGEGGKEITLGSVKPTGGWRNYEAELQPVMPILDKWVKHFGYD
jgi:tetratricopeptide (TPR) repeat protein